MCFRMLFLELWLMRLLKELLYHKLGLSLLCPVVYLSNCPTLLKFIFCSDIVSLRSLVMSLRPGKMGPLTKALTSKHENLGLDPSTYVLSMLCVVTFIFSEFLP